MAELYKGIVSHSRRIPAQHSFSYGVCMMLVDVNCLDSTFKGLWPLAGVNKPLCVASFHESDHMKNWRKPGQSLGDCVRDVIQTATGRRPSDAAPIKLLTHLRYFGYCFNPISVYYVYSDDGKRVDSVIAEVSNTPWMEMHLYTLHDGAPGVLKAYSCISGHDWGAEAGEGAGASAAAARPASPARRSRSPSPIGAGRASPRSASTGRAGRKGSSTTAKAAAEAGSSSSLAPGGPGPSPSFLAPGTRLLHYSWSKDFHVSPFMDLDQTYHWVFSEPGDKLMTRSLNTRNSDGAHMFTTLLQLERQGGQVTAGQLAWTVFLAFPLLTWRLQWWIHYEAVRLFRKGVELYPHPQGTKTGLIVFMEGVFSLVMAVWGLLTGVYGLLCCRRDTVKAGNVTVHKQ